MRRGGVGLFLGALAALTVSSPPRLTAQTTAPPEGWVVLPLDEYKALREKALPAGSY